VTDVIDSPYESSLEPRALSLRVPGCPAYRPNERPLPSNHRVRGLDIFLCGMFESCAVSRESAAWVESELKEVRYVAMKRGQLWVVLDKKINLRSADTRLARTPKRAHDG
jgi:hypothetical protein